ncbi:MAG: hypothetical protein ACT4QE_23840 [Anaerolineales bacterium]
MTAKTTAFVSVERPGLGRLHALLFVQTIVIILGSINRLGSFTLGYVAPNEFLRWVDFHNMLTLPLISLGAFYLLKKTLEYDSPQREGRWHLALNLTFILGLYLLGASYGTHEVTNYLSFRFCREVPTTDLCRIVIFNDDEFSHWVFFTGFVMVNAALMFFQVLFPHRGTGPSKAWAGESGTIVPTRSVSPSPRSGAVTTLDKVLLGVNAVFIGAGIFANLAFEVIGLDLYVVALLAVVAVGLLWRKGAQPLLIYYSVAYVLGLIATFAYKTFL